MLLILWQTMSFSALFCLFNMTNRSKKGYLGGWMSPTQFTLFLGAVYKVAMLPLLCVFIMILYLSPSWQASTSCSDALRHPNCRLMPDIEDCGIQNICQRMSARLFGGRDARPTEFPWFARMGYTKKGDSGQVKYLCGGSVINERYVLTAAHCCRHNQFGPPVVVHLGEHNSKNDDYKGRRCRQPAQDYKVESVIIHSNYDRDTYQHDICLVRLKYLIEINLIPICLLYSERTFTRGATTYTMEVAGWGRSYEKADGSYGTPEVLQTLKLPLIPLPLCQWIYRLLQYEVTSSQLCAGGMPGQNVCSGDSGGPLMARYLEREGLLRRYFLVGVTSMAQMDPCAGLLPSVYVNVLNYTTWILDQMKS